MRPRRTKEALAYARQADWNYSQRHHYAGHYACTGPCGLVAFCVGRYRETVKCRECSGVPKEQAV